MKNKKIIILFILLMSGLLLFNPSKYRILNYKQKVKVYSPISGNIKWDDNNNINGKRPQEITLSVYEYDPDNHSYNKKEEQTLPVTGDSQYSFELYNAAIDIITVNKVEDYVVIIDNNNNITYKYSPNNTREYPTFIYGVSSIKIIDKETNNNVSGFECLIKTYYGNNEIPLAFDIQYEDYYGVDTIEEIIDINNVLSKTQVDAITKIKKLKDLESFYSYDIITNLNQENKYVDYYGERIYYYEIILPTFFVLEEKQSPTGYVKEKYLIPGTIYLNYKLLESDINSENLTDSKIELNYIHMHMNDDTSYFEYDDYKEEDYLGSDYVKTHSFWTTNASKKGCTIPDLSTVFRREKDVSEERINNSKEYSSGNCSLTFIAHKGSISLSVDNKVNETDSITTTINTKLTYSVTLKNTGEIDAIDSVLTSKIPEGFKYVEGSASNNGEYKDGEIQWRVGRINAGEEKTFTFNVLVPKGTNITKEYIGESSVTNFAMQNRVDSGKTVVKLSLINPNTITPITIIILVGITLLLLTVLIINFYKNKQENKLYDNF